MSSPPGQEDLRRAGLKATRPRLHVIDVLRATRQRHLTAEQIFTTLRDSGVRIAMGTVYRVVASLEHAGFVRRLHVSGDQSAVYELADSATHDHMVCLDTGRILEFQDHRLLETAREIAAREGYGVEGHSLVLYVRKLKGGRERGAGKRSTS